MKLALHRSVTFWCGLMVMAGLCWGWRDSRTHSLTYYYKKAEASVFPGGVVFARNAGETTTPGLTREPNSEFIQAIAWHWFPGPYLLKGEEKSELAYSDGTPPTVEAWHREWIARESRENLMLFIPYWLMVLAVALPWAGLLAWRGWRMRKHVTMATTP